MPTYLCTTRAEALDDDERSAIAGVIARAHGDATGAPEFFVQTSFVEAEPGHRYLGTVASDDHVVDGAGRQHPLDSHKPAEFAGRTHNFVVGSEPVLLATPTEVERGRAESTAGLAELFGKTGERPIDIIGRMKKLDEQQVDAIVDWLCAIKREAR